MRNYVISYLFNFMFDAESKHEHKKMHQEPNKFHVYIVKGDHCVAACQNKSRNNSDGVTYPYIKQSHSR